MANVLYAVEHLLEVVLVCTAALVIACGFVMAGILSKDLMKDYNKRS